MTRWLSKLIARLFVKLFAVAFTQLEASLDLVLMETQEELLDEAERSERRAGIVAAPVAMQLRAAAQRLSVLPIVSADEPQAPREPEKPAVKRPLKPKTVSAASEKRGRGRPRKMEVAALEESPSVDVPASKQ